MIGKTDARCHIQPHQDGKGLHRSHFHLLDVNVLIPWHFHRLYHLEAKVPTHSHSPHLEDLGTSYVCLWHLYMNLKVAEICQCRQLHPFTLKLWSVWE